MLDEGILAPDFAGMGLFGGIDCEALLWMLAVFRTCRLGIMPNSTGRGFTLNYINLLTEVPCPRPIPQEP